MEGIPVKKTIGIFLCLLLVCLCAFALADPDGGKCGDHLTWTLEGSVLTISGTGDMYDYEKYSEVPWFSYTPNYSELVIGKNVTGIGAYAFALSPLKSVTIPGNIKSIHHHAFWCSSNLEEVTLPEGLTEIADQTFLSCYHLKKINIPSTVKKMGKYCLEQCTDLTSIELPNGLQTLGDGVFNHDTGLTAIDIPATVTSIGSNTFYNTGLKTIAIPKGITTIPDSCFSSCEKLVSITIPKSVTLIEKFAFWFTDTLKDIYYGGTEADWKKVTVEDCNEPVVNAEIHYTGGDPDEEPQVTVSGGKYKLNKKKTAAIFTGPEKKSAAKLKILDTVKIGGKTYNVTGIAAAACSGMKKLTELTIGKKVKTIEKDAFEDCVKLAKVSGGSSVQSIGDEAFENCKALKAFTLGSKVKKIGEEAFNWCSALVTITVRTTLLTAKNVGKNAFANLGKKPVFKCPKNKTDAYRKIFLKKGAPKASKFE